MGQKELGHRSHRIYDAAMLLARRERIDAAAPVSGHTRTESMPPKGSARDSWRGRLGSAARAAGCRTYARCAVAVVR